LLVVLCCCVRDANAWGDGFSFEEEIVLSQSTTRYEIIRNFKQIASEVHIVKRCKSGRWMKQILVCAFFLAASISARAGSTKSIPVVIELFTSEGCSSCPPADRLLASLDRDQPVAGAQLIVLSEHVDYWNTQGWIDPFSSHEFSERQQRYGEALRVDDVYTPQAVIDGRLQVVGNSAPKMEAAIQQALKEKKVPLSLQVSRSETGIHIELQASEGAKRGAEVYLAVAEDEVQSNVSAGENSGRVLAHTAVVRSLTKVGRLQGENRVAADLKTSAHWGKRLRVVALLEEHDGGKILGAAVAGL